MRSVCIALLMCIASSQAIAHNDEKPQVGKGAIEGKVSATVVTWSVLGIAFLITIGVVTAVAIHRDK